MVAWRDDNGRMHGRMHEYRDTKRTLNCLTDLSACYPPCLENEGEEAIRRGASQGRTGGVSKSACGCTRRG